ncbi:hypothetical protein DF16_pBMB293orf00175 (plasmid) [Bacillus thuringiensis serovar kurstaki str. YBT-1520]|nr:hypothetical protein H175_285p247 [Bacillus thuringiensis serovar thuringiensis str. IS5056]AIM34699.1 hypothetical protein DF16_pBMB293orf00175 [Bacillus thuringiensis serovar kurstaki str. YBT-1520]
MHKKIRFPGRMIVTQTITGKDVFTSMITNFDQKNPFYKFYLRM